MCENPATSKDEVHVGGEPVGFVIELENGLKIYHMGDTGLFGDMKFIGDYYKPDVLLIPIGGNFTMGPVDAAYATREWIKPKTVIPMHYVEPIHWPRVRPRNTCRPWTMLRSRCWHSNPAKRPSSEGMKEPASRMNQMAIHHDS